MKNGDIMEVSVCDFDMNGEGVVKTEEGIVFVPFAMKGEKIKLLITAKGKNVTRGKMIKLIEPSKDRVNPVCPVFGKCGGCMLQHMRAECQREVKKNALKNTLRKAVGELSVDDMVSGEKEYGYRNKLQIPFTKSNGAVRLGFFAEKTHQVIPVSSCPLSESYADKLIALVTEWANAHRLTVYDEGNGFGLLRHLVARKIGETLCVVVVVNGFSLPFADDLQARLNRKFQSFQLFYNCNRDATNVILGRKTVCVYGSGKAETEVLGLKMKLSPLSFMQVNDEIRDRIYLDATSKLDGIDKVIELYSGVGIMSALAAKKGIESCGIEIVREAVEDARQMAEKNGIENVRFIAGDVAEKLSAELEGGKKEIAVILDPPRAGCEKKVLEQICQAPPKSILYLSCNPATLARDLAILSPLYTVQSVTPYDMFPQTKHVETLARLVRKDEKRS